MRTFRTATSPVPVVFSRDIPYGLIYSDLWRKRGTRQIGDNQTSESILANISPQTLGSGVFAVPNPKLAELGAITKVICEQDYLP
jgi:hypothetical protein